MTIAYSVFFALSLVFPCIYYLGGREKQREPWLLVLYLCVCVVNLGYLLLSLSKTIEFALAANKIAYLGQVFLTMCMYKIISKLCGFHHKRWVTYALIGLAILMYSMVLTTGHLDWYYKSVSLTFVDGAAKLVKDYGVLHPVYTVYVILYLVAMLVTIFYSLGAKKVGSHKLAGLMLGVVFGNIGMWLVEKLITWNFEFLSVSYLMSELVFFFIFWLLQDYVPAGESKPVIIVASDLTHAEKLERVLATLPEGTHLSQRQTEVLECILDGKSRKEIAAELHISENTVKMHTSALYRLLNVSGKSEIYALFK